MMLNLNYLMVFLSSVGFGWHFMRAEYNLMFMNLIILGMNIFIINIKKRGDL